MSERQKVVVTDFIETTQGNLDACRPRSIDDIRQAGKPLAVLSGEIYEQHLSLKQFLNRHLYSHEQKLEMTARVQVMGLSSRSLYIGSKSPSELACLRSPC